MAINTQIQIYIGETSIPVFKSLTLHQEIDAHHDFELVCRKDVLEKTEEAVSLDSINFLGEVFLLQIESLNGFSNNETLKFKGIVTTINTTKGFYQNTGDLVHIKGKSSSIITDDGPHYASHTNKSLSQILENTFAGYNLGKLQFQVTPQKTDSIYYSVQQEESAFEYASRLAAQYGEWFYYNGTKLIFGKPEHIAPISLKYGYDLLELSTHLEAIPNSFKYFTNDYLNDTFHEVKTESVASNIKGVNTIVAKKSSELFNKETQVFISAFDDPQMKSRIDEQVYKQKKTNEINQVKVKGKSSNPNITVGKIITIEGASLNGNYRITKAVHNCNENGRYENNFEAVTADVEISPKTSFKAFPKSKAQTAVVVNNNDPEGLGRVQVQYPWQKPIGETTPFIRLSSTAAGAGQGFFMVPEIGDEVVVDYEGGNAESPIVQGSLYNASSVPESFKSGNNHLKAIKTRSGNQVTLNDADGSVTIADPSGNTIVMGGNGEITINAPNKITFSSTDINIEASNDLTVNAGNNITSSAAKDISTSAGTNLSMDAGSDLKAKAGSKASIKGDKSVTVFGKRVSITGSVMTNIQSSAVVTIITAGVLNLTGAASNLISGALVKVVGKKVDIN